MEKNTPIAFLVVRDLQSAIGELKGLVSSLALGLTEADDLGVDVAAERAHLRDQLRSFVERIIELMVPLHDADNQAYARRVDLLLNELSPPS